MKKIVFKNPCKRPTVDKSGNQVLVDTYCIGEMQWSEENELWVKEHAYNGEYSIVDDTKEG
jgi:hypothetical protein